MAAEAAASGVRLYTVYGSGHAESASRDIANALTTLASSAGGRVFLRGEGSDHIHDVILGDVSSTYLISFDPTGLPQDAPLRVQVNLYGKRIRARTHRTLLIRSESERVAALLMALHLGGSTDHGSIPVAVSIIPTGHRDGVFRALVQIVGEGRFDTGSSCQVATSLASSGQKRRHVIQEAALKHEETRVVLETDMSFSPGPFELAVIFRDRDSGTFGSARVQGSWPDPDEATITLLPVAVLQGGNGLFVRGSAERAGGALSTGDTAPLQTDRPTALMFLVCRDRTLVDNIRVLRTVSGETSAEFQPVDLDLDDERCGLIRDVIPGNVLDEGYFRYEIRVLDDQVEVGVGERVFAAMRELNQ